MMSPLAGFLHVLFPRTHAYAEPLDIKYLLSAEYFHYKVSVFNTNDILYGCTHVLIKQVTEPRKATQL